MKSFKLVVIALAVVALCAGTAQAQGLSKSQEQAQNPGASQPPAFRVASVPPRPAPGPNGGTVTATVQYDNGTLTALPVGFDFIVGNVFDRPTTAPSWTGNVTLNSFSFYFMEDSIADTGLFFNVADPVNSSTISSRVSVNIGGLANSGQSFSSPTLNVIPQSALGTTGVFSNTMYMGVWTLNSATTFPVDNETIGLNDTAPLLGGFQGYTAGTDATGPILWAPGSFHAIIRANLTYDPIPVEVMAFEVD